MHKAVYCCKGDVMTETLNHLEDRAAFDEALQVAVNTADGDGASVSVAVVDVDLLGQINEKQGQDAGDAALEVVADHLSAILNGDRKLYRFGGDAFSVLMMGVEKEHNHYH